MAIQWLRLCTSTEGVTGLIPGQGSSACYDLQPRKKTSYRATLGKYFQNTSDKGPVSMIYKVHSEFNNEETNSLITKWAKYVNRHFTKEDIEMANKSMESCSASLVTRETQIKTRHVTQPLERLKSSQRCNFNRIKC